MRSQRPRAARRTVINVTGDEFNGDALFRTKHGIQGEHWESTDDEDNDNGARSRVTLWRYSLPDAVFSEHNWARKDAAAIAKTHGQTLSSLIAASTSRNPAERQQALEMIAGYHGWTNIDGYPLETTAGGMRRRWPRRL